MSSTNKCGATEYVWFYSRTAGFTYSFLHNYWIPVAILSVLISFPDFNDPLSLWLYYPHVLLRSRVPYTLFYAKFVKKDFSSDLGLGSRGDG